MQQISLHNPQVGKVIIRYGQYCWSVFSVLCRRNEHVLKISMRRIIMLFYSKTSIPTFWFRYTPWLTLNSAYTSSMSNESFDDSCAVEAVDATFEGHGYGLAHEWLGERGGARKRWICQMKTSRLDPCPNAAVSSSNWLNVKKVDRINHAHQLRQLQSWAMPYLDPWSWWCCKVRMAASFFAHATMLQKKPSCPLESKNPTMT